MVDIATRQQGGGRGLPDADRGAVPGAAGAVLGVLTRTTEPLTVRQLADRANVSHPQVSHHVERLETLGVVSRHIAGRSHQITLTDGAAAFLLRQFAGLRDDVLDHMRATAAELDPAPDSIVVFGSFGRGTARAHSDIDIAVVASPAWVADEGCLAQLASWLDEVAAFAGNPVAEILVTPSDLADRRDEPIWGSIRDEAVVLLGVAPHLLIDTDPKARG